MTGTMKTTISTARRKILPGLRAVSTACCGAGPGTTFRRSSARPTGQEWAGGPDPDHSPSASGAPGKWIALDAFSLFP
jgi:hypothetical protein